MDRRGSLEKGHKWLKTLQPSARSFLNLPPLLLARAVGLQHLWWGVGWGAEVRSDLEAHHSTGNGISNLGIKGWQKSLAGPLTTVLLSTLSSYRPALKQPHPAPRPAPITYAKWEASRHLCSTVKTQVCTISQLQLGFFLVPTFRIFQTPWFERTLSYCRWCCAVLWCSVYLLAQVLVNY